MVQHSDTGGGKMIYAVVVHYISEKDTSITLKEETIGEEAEIGDAVNFYLYDFEIEGKTQYVKYAICNGSVFCRNSATDTVENRIAIDTMFASESRDFRHWFVMCTDDANEVTGDNYAELNEIANEIFITLNDKNINTKGSEYVSSINITNGSIGEQFASYGSTFSPTISCEMFSCDFTDNLISGNFYSDTGVIINAYFTIYGQEQYPIPMGRFVVRDEPVFVDDVVSFNGIGITEAYMERAEIDIEALNKYHKNEIEEKYVTNGYMDFVVLRNDVYFWEFLPEDFLRVTGCPLYIDKWGAIKKEIYEYRIAQLMIPCLENVVQTEVTDDSGYVTSYEYNVEYKSRITWRELLSGIAILLRSNVIEKNGAFYIKRMPRVKESGYREVFNSSAYDSSAQFGKRFMCPSISVKGNNWFFYSEEKTAKLIGFGYYDGESKAVLNNKKSTSENVSYYDVDIECPWIMFETENIDQKKYKQMDMMYFWLGHEEVMQWKTELSKRDQAFVYSKANYTSTMWHPLMMAGEMNIVEDYDGVKRYVYIGEITIHYDGSIYADISSPCEIDAENISSSGGVTSSVYSDNEKANQEGVRSKTSNKILVIDNKIDMPSTYSATIPYFEFENFDIEEPMNVTLTEVTE